jgi:hypothetical protein
MTVSLQKKEKNRQNSYSEMWSGVGVDRLLEVQVKFIFKKSFSEFHISKSSKKFNDIFSIV